MIDFDCLDTADLRDIRGAVHTALAHDSAADDGSDDRDRRMHRYGVLIRRCDVALDNRATDYYSGGCLNGHAGCDGRCHD